MSELPSAIIGDDTIAAIATAPGRGALAIVRVSGGEVRQIAARILSPSPNEPRRSIVATVHDVNGEPIDEALVTLFIAPHSFTGEDLLEISCHGGAVVPASVLGAVIGAGARMAAPGEFTRRAVLNGKIDLLQAEAIGDLIDARTSAAHSTALRQLDGGLSQRLEDMRRQLLALDAMLAYDIDFPEEDDGPVPSARIAAAAHDVLGALDALLATSSRGAIVNEGALVVLAGAPNAGKSSLFNALLGEARAIVTDIPGTTRDAIEAVLDLPDWPLRLVDTAGLRESTDLVEQLGIATTEKYLSHAVVILSCVDLSDRAPAKPTKPHNDQTTITVGTKADLVSESYYSRVDVAVSARSGRGLHDLLTRIQEMLSRTVSERDPDAPVLTRARHRAAVSGARDELQQFITLWEEQSIPASLAAIHIRAAMHALEELIGTVDVDDVLDVLFRSFCVGK